MIIRLDRYNYSAQSTTGNLSFPDSVNFCYTLEDTVRAWGIKVKGHTAIPETGETDDITCLYKIGMRYSPGLKRECPVIYTRIENNTIYILEKNNIRFDYCMFHGGNRHQDTDSCPLVAYNRRDDDTIQGTAEKEVTAKIKELSETGDVYLMVVNHFK